MKIEVVKNVLKYNKDQADANRKLFNKKNIFAINLLSSPGAGKTSIIIETIKMLKKEISIGVIEGDVSSTHDAEKIKKYTDNVVQINTGGTCHLNATMVDQALSRMNLDKIDMIMIENVGNLICPVGFDLGEDYKIVISSVTEGDDKPVKYPNIFIRSDIVLLNKMDMLDFTDFDIEFFKEKVKKLNFDATIMEISCKKGIGLSGWSRWLKSGIKG
jgi:hydrogenase nickel incorporation protein HypB